MYFYSSSYRKAGFRGGSAIICSMPDSVILPQGRCEHTEGFLPAQTFSDCRAQGLPPRKDLSIIEDLAMPFPVVTAAYADVSAVIQSVPASCL